MFWINLVQLHFHSIYMYTRVPRGYYLYRRTTCTGILLTLLLLSLRIAIVIDLALHAVHGLFLFDGIATQVR